MSREERMREFICLWCGESFCLEDQVHPLPSRMCSQECFELAMQHLQETLDSRLSSKKAAA